MSKTKRRSYDFIIGNRKSLFAVAPGVGTSNIPESVLSDLR
ncbi:hypothetical protein [Mesobacillus maritimus]|nr:hypothetical protein [Mesobacillus maritimus]